MPCLDGGPRCERDIREDKVDNLLEYICGSLCIDMRECNSLDEKTDYLCYLCKNMLEEDKEKFMYNGRKLMARRLADWWDKHQEEDKIRILKEKKKEEQRVLKRQAWNKLSPAERKAWNLNFGKEYNDE